MIAGILFGFIPLVIWLYLLLGRLPNHLHMLLHHGIADLAQRVLRAEHIARLN